ncbi:MAG: hypothetical protein ACR2P4_02115 [Gammaproteobacteria bacterium]
MQKAGCRKRGADLAEVCYYCFAGGLFFGELSGAFTTTKGEKP